MVGVEFNGGGGDHIEKFLDMHILLRGCLGFDRYVTCRVAGRGRLLASLNICHKGETYAS